MAFEIYKEHGASSLPTADSIKNFLTENCSELENVTVTGTSPYAIKFVINGIQVAWNMTLISSYYYGFTLSISRKESGEIDFLALTTEYGNGAKNLAHYESAYCAGVYGEDMGGNMKTITANASKYNMYTYWNTFSYDNLPTPTENIFLTQANRMGTKIKNLYIGPDTIFPSGIKITDGTSVFMSIGAQLFYKCETGT